MVYITGDTHGNEAQDAEKLSKKSMEDMGITFPTEKDKVIICGGFGFPFYPTREERIKHQITLVCFIMIITAKTGMVE